jgi:heterodisulfide reductase subunit C
MVLPISGIGISPACKPIGGDEQLNTIATQIKSVVNEDVNLCYQCEKCTSGCPVSKEMELVPAQIMHAAQLNMKEMILKANTIWLCASCETCTTRCPQGIDISKVMDSLRIIARREKVKAKVPLVPLFYKLCLMSLKFVGCIYEAGLAGLMRLKAGLLVKDRGLAIAMLKKGKIKILPIFRSPSRVRRIVRKVKKFEEV